MQFIKKYWYMLILIVFLIIAICFYVKSSKKEQSEETAVDSKVVTEYAIDYFENLVNIANISEYDVTVEMLKNAKNNQLADYDMNELNKCDDDSYVKFVLKTDGKGYESYESNLICQK